MEVNYVREWLASSAGPPEATQHLVERRDTRVSIGDIFVRAAYVRDPGADLRCPHEDGKHLRIKQEVRSIETFGVRFAVVVNGVKIVQFAGIVG